MKNKRQPRLLAWPLPRCMPAASLLGGCAALVVGGAVGTALVVTDRRTSGTQLEDQTIELKAVTRIREAVGERGHVNATSYNRVVLLTGEVPSEADRRRRRAGGRAHRKRALVVNELAVMRLDLADRALERHHPDEQGQGELHRREGRAGQRRSRSSPSAAWST